MYRFHYGFWCLLAAALWLYACSDNEQALPPDVESQPDIVASDTAVADAGPTSDVAADVVDVPPPPKDTGPDIAGPDETCPGVTVESPIDGDVYVGTLPVSLSVSDPSGIAAVQIKDSATGDLLLDLVVPDGATVADLTGSFDICRYGTGQVLFALNLLDEKDNGCNRQLRPVIVRCPRFEGHAQHGAPGDAPVNDVAAVDFDGDGDLDVVSATDAGVLGHPNLGQLRFGPPVVLASGAAAFVTPGDLDGDDDVDLIVVRTSDGASTVEVTLRQPEGYVVAETHEVAAEVTAVEYVDVAPDAFPKGGTANRPDLLLATSNPDMGLGVLIREEGVNAGVPEGQAPWCAVWPAADPMPEHAVTECFGAPVWRASFGGLTSLAVGDLVAEENGALDVVATNDKKHLQVFVGDGAGGFPSVTLTELESAASGVLIDGFDVTFTLPDEGAVTRLTGLQDGTFDTLNPWTVAVDGEPFAPATLNERLLLGNATTDTLWTLIEDQWQVVDTVQGAKQIVVVDMDEDGQEDALVRGATRFAVTRGGDFGQLLGPVNVRAQIGSPDVMTITAANHVALLTSDGLLENHAATVVKTALAPQDPTRLIRAGDNLLLADALATTSLSPNADGSFGSLIVSAAPPIDVDAADDGTVVVLLDGKVERYVDNALVQTVVLEQPAHAVRMGAGPQLKTYVAAGTGVTALGGGTVEIGGPFSVFAVGDLGGSGADDIAAVREDGAVWYLGEIHPMAGQGSQVEIADINADGLDDLLVLDAPSRRIAVFVNSGDSQLWPQAAEIRIGPKTLEFEVADVDEDGCLDVVTMSKPAKAAVIHRNVWGSSPGGCAE